MNIVYIYDRIIKKQNVHTECYLAASCSTALAPDMSTKLPAEEMENVTDGLLSRRLFEPLQLLVLKSLLRRFLREPFLVFPGTFSAFSLPHAARVAPALLSACTLGLETRLELALSGRTCTADSTDDGDVGNCDESLSGVLP